MNTQQYHSDNIIVALLLIAAVCAVAVPYLVSFELLAGWPDGAGVPGFIPIFILGILGYASLRLSIRTGDAQIKVIMSFAVLLIAIRIIYFPGLHWANLNWLIIYISNMLRFGYLLPATIICGACLIAGQRIAAEGTDHLSALSILTSALGFLVAIMTISLLPAFNVDAIQSQFTLPIIVFFSCGLCALALSKLESIREMCGRSGTYVSNSWQLTIIVLGLVILMASALAATSVNPAIPSPIIKALSAIWMVVVIGLELLLYPVTFAVAGLYKVLAYLASFFNPEYTHIEVAPGGWDTHLDPDLSQLSRIDFRLAVGAVAIIIVLLLLTRMFARSKNLDGRRLVFSLQEQRSSTLGEGFSAPTGKQISPEDMISEQAHASQMALRQAFSRVLAWTRDHCLPVTPTDTPGQYPLRLSPNLGPEQKTSLSELIALYLPVRYGCHIPTESEIARARQLADAITGMDPTPPEG